MQSHEFANPLLNSSESAGEPSARGKTFCLNQQATAKKEAGNLHHLEPSLQALSYASWGTFDYRYDD